MNENAKQGIFLGTGRRKSSVARVELFTGSGETFMINNQAGVDYMQENTYLIGQMKAPLTFLDVTKQYDICIQVRGGGLVGQAGAIRLALARALCNFSPDYRSSLKLKGYLVRDARVKERKKYGLKKARKAPQFSKR